MARALQVADTSERRFWRQNLATTAEVLWESRKDDRWYGTTDNYIRVHTDGDFDLANRLGSARLETITQEGVGCVLGTSPPMEPTSLPFTPADGGTVSLPSS
jgi:hypothetical protein